MNCLKLRKALTTKAFLNFRIVGLKSYKLYLRVIYKDIVLLINRTSPAITYFIYVNCLFYNN